MKRPLPKTFDELMKCHYGRDLAPMSTPVRVFDMLANYYGKPSRTHHAKSAAAPRLAASARTLSVLWDDNERLPQRRKSIRYEEYVAPFAIDPATEYVFDVGPSAITTAGGAISSPAATGLADQAAPPASQPARPPGSVDSTPSDTKSGKSTRSAPSTSAEGAPASKAGAVMSEPAKSTPRAVAPTHSEDSLMNDIQAILNGEVVYDPHTKKTVAPSELKAPPDGAANWLASSPSAPPSTPSRSEGDAIFEKLAQSMQYANVYDIGTVELGNRFAEFDKIDELKRKAAAERKTRSETQPVTTGEPASIGTAEFIQDMDEIRRQAMEAVVPAPVSAGAHGNVGLAQGSASAAPAAEISRPFFDTGEHVLVGGSHYVDQLRVGASPGVAFSYGQLIAMADLFESVDQMMNTNSAELSRIKTLIDRSTAYYVENQSDPAKNVADDEWDSVTGGRYLKLAEMNFEHFSPNFLFRKAIAQLTAAADRHGNNKSAWEASHKRAIQEAQAVALASGGNSSPMLPIEWPLIINAFGDHFLTDAFAAGHLISKDFVAALWKSLFYDGGVLNSEAKGFFSRLADRAFSLGKVKEKFSELETVRSYYLVFHPNINSPERFASVLSGIADKEPDRIANLVIKAIHDRLNTDGVEVFNNAGDGSWVLKGDGTLDVRNRGIVQRAVDQSIANINDPSILASNIDFATYFARVWKHVPQLSPASEEKVQRLVRQFVNPDSNVLVEAAAHIIKNKVDVLIRELIRAGALRRA